MLHQSGSTFRHGALFLILHLQMVAPTCSIWIPLPITPFFLILKSFYSIEIMMFTKKIDQKIFFFGRVASNIVLKGPYHDQPTFYMLKHLFCRFQRHFCCPDWIFDSPRIKQKLKFLALVRHVKLAIRNNRWHVKKAIRNNKWHAKMAIRNNKWHAK